MTSPNQRRAFEKRGQTGVLEDSDTVSPRFPRRDLWAFAFVLGLFFAFLEILKTHRSSLWTGGTRYDWLGVFVGLILYAVVVGVITECLWALLGGTTRKRLSSTVGVPYSGVVAAGLVWVLLSMHREYVPTFEDALVVAALAAFGSASTLLPSMGLMSPRALYGATGVALASSIPAAAAFGQMFLFHAERAKVVTAASVTWCAAACAVALLGWGFRTKPFAKTRRVGVSLLLLGLPFLVMCVPLGSHDAGNNRKNAPNIVLIVLDTLRADYCSAYGGPCPTPSLAAMAGRGVLFERCYSLAPWTPPSMTAMLASAYPPGLTPGPTRETWLDEVWRYSLRVRDASLAEACVSAGYTTCALVANPMLRGLAGVLRGFETTRFSHPMILRKSGLFRYCPFLQDTLSAGVPSLVEERYNDTTAALTRYALAYLRRHRTAPFFLWVHYIDPHSPYDPPDAYRTLTGQPRAFAPHMNNQEWVEAKPHGKPLADMPERDRAYIRSLYEGEIRYVDDAVGRIRAELARLGLDDCTYVCVTSDHGEELWDHGGWGHGQTVYDELVRVPLIIAGPGVQSRRVKEAVSAIDLMPTLADLAALATPAPWQGKTWGPVLRDARRDPSPAPCFSRGTSFRAETEPLEMVVLDKYKLVQDARSGNVELYDLDEDPMEYTNVAEQRPGLVAERTALLDQWRAAYPSTFDVFLDGEHAPQNREEVLRLMEAIGYL